VELGLDIMFIPKRELAAPVPYAQYNLYLGHYPFYGKIGLGAIAELILGGHIAGYFRFGMEVDERFEVSCTIVPVGTEPNVSYTDLKSKKGDPGYVAIDYPYFAVTFVYKVDVFN